MSGVHVESELLGLQQLMAAEPSDDLRRWYLEEYEQTLNGQLLRHALYGRLAVALSHLQQASEESGAQPNHQLGETSLSAENGSLVEASNENSEVIDWAVQTSEKFNQLSTSLKDRKLDRQDQRFVRGSFRELESKLDGKSLHQDPAVVSQVLETWATIAHENGDRSKRLLTVATDILGETAKTEWHQLKRELLAGYIKVLATNGLSRPGVETILSKHFEGPKTEMERLEAYAELGLSAGYLLNDPHAIETLARITNFQTKILTLDGPVFAAFMSAGHRADDAELCGVGQDVFSIGQGVSFLSDTRTAFNEATNSSRAKELVNQRVEIAMSNLAAEKRIPLSKALDLVAKRLELIDRQPTIIRRTDSEKFEQISKDYGEEEARWFESVRFNHTSYMDDYLRSFGNRQMRDTTSEYLEMQLSEKTRDIISLPLDESIIDIFISDRISDAEVESRFEQIIAKALEGAAAAKDEASRVMKDGDISASVFFNVPLGDKALFAIYRGKCFADTLREHELNQLIWCPLPDIDDPLFDSTHAIIQRIDQHERRFVSRRGFKVRFVSPELVDKGYESMSFRANASHANILDVQLHHRGRPIHFKMGAYRQLDTEGRAIHSTRVKNVTERRALALLEDYATREAIETSEGNISGSEQGTTSRIATLVYLPLGHNFTDEAWQHYRKERGGDLRARSVMRKILDSKGRNTTYRRATEVDDPNLEPVEIYVEDKRIV